MDANLSAVGHGNNLVVEHRQDAESIHTVQTPELCHTPKCLAKRLAELELRLYGCFPAEAADFGLDAASDAGLRHIKQVQKGEPCELTDGKNWLLCVAIRAVFRYLTRQPHHVSIDFAKWPQEAIDREQRRGDLTEVRDVFEMLPVRQKEAVFLRIFMGLSLRAAAREMGIEPQTVGSYLEKAYARMRKFLSVPSSGENNYSACARAS